MRRNIGDILMATVFGSKLYGTATPESDTDYKGVFLPSVKNIILQQVPKAMCEHTKKNKESKNTADDFDQEIYSLHYFLKLACAGETVAIDMLHVPLEKLEVCTDIWENIYSNRSKFYTKKLNSYLGYCRTQAAKYGIKGSRLSTVKEFLNFLSEYNNDYTKLIDIYDKVPEIEHLHKVTIENCRGNDPRAIEICGKKFMVNSKITQIVHALSSFYNAYGERAKKAEKNEGIDWKAISHAFRAGYQLKEIYETGDLIYPLKDAKFLTDIKIGKYHYLNDCIGEKLEQLIDSVYVLADKSSYPEKVDNEYWDEFILNVYNKKLGG